MGRTERRRWPFRPLIGSDCSATKYERHQWRNYIIEFYSRCLTMIIYQLMNLFQSANNNTKNISFFSQSIDKNTWREFCNAQHLLRFSITTKQIKLKIEAGKNIYKTPNTNIYYQLFNDSMCVHIGLNQNAFYITSQISNESYKVRKVIEESPFSFQMENSQWEWVHRCFIIYSSSW